MAFIDGNKMVCMSIAGNKMVHESSPSTSPLTNVLPVLLFSMDFPHYINIKDLALTAGSCRLISEIENKIET